MVARTKDGTLISALILICKLSSFLPRHLLASPLSHHLYSCGSLERIARWPFMPELISLTTGVLWGDGQWVVRIPKLEGQWSAAAVLWLMEPWEGLARSVQIEPHGAAAQTAGIGLWLLPRLAERFQQTTQCISEQVVSSVEHSFFQLFYSTLLPGITAFQMSLLAAWTAHPPAWKPYIVEVLGACIFGRQVATDCFPCKGAR